MTANGITIIERQFMDTLIRNSKRIADALDKANELKAAEIAAQKETAEKLDALIEAVKYLR